MINAAGKQKSIRRPTRSPINKNNIYLPAATWHLMIAAAGDDRRCIVWRCAKWLHVHSSQITTYGTSQGRRSWGLRPVAGVRTPLEICRGVRVCFDPPENVTFFHLKLLLYNCKFDTVEQLNTLTSPSLTLLMLTMLPSLAPSRQCPPINAVAAILDYLSWPKTKLQNVGADDPAINNPHRWCTS